MLIAAPGNCYTVVFLAMTSCRPRVSNLFWQRAHILLLACSQATHIKLTINVVTNILNYRAIFIVQSSVA